MNSEPIKPLSTKQKKAIQALLEFSTVEKASEEAGVARQTLFRWRKDPIFQAALRDAEAEALAEVARILTRVSKSAAVTMAEIMRSADSDATRLRAADSILGRLLELRKQLDIEVRVDGLEEAYQQLATTLENTK